MKTNTCSRDRLFFDQYQYVLSFRLRSVNCLRGLGKYNDTEGIKNAHLTVDSRFEHRNRVRNYGGNWAANPSGNIGQTQHNIHALLDVLTEKLSNNHMTVTVDYAYVYSNDLDWLTKIAALPYLNFVKLREAVVDRPRDTVYLTQSEYTNRSYFRECWITAETKVVLRGFLNNQENIKLSPSLGTWINKDYNHNNGRALLARHYFFDHNSDKIPFMLSLAAPKLIRCTLQVLAK